MGTNLFILVLFISLAYGYHHVSEYSSHLSNEDVNDDSIDDIERFDRKTRLAQKDYNIEVNQKVSDDITELKEKSEDLDKIAEATLTRVTLDHTNSQINPHLPDVQAEESYPINKIGEIPSLQAHGFSDPVPVLSMTFGRFNTNCTDNKMNITDPIIDNIKIKRETNNTKNSNQTLVLSNVNDDKKGLLEPTSKEMKGINIIIRFKRSLLKRHRWSSILINGDYSTPNKSTTAIPPTTTTESTTRVQNEVRKDYDVDVKNFTKINGEPAPTYKPKSVMFAPSGRPCLACGLRTTTKKVYTPKRRYWHNRDNYYM